MDRLGDLPGVSGLRVIDDNTLHDGNPPLLNEPFFAPHEFEAEWAALKGLS